MLWYLILLLRFVNVDGDCECVIPPQFSDHVQSAPSVIISSVEIQPSPVFSMIESSFEVISPAFTSTTGGVNTPPYSMVESSLEMESSCLSYSVTPSCTVVTPSTSFSIAITNCTEEFGKLKKELQGKTMAEVIERFEGNRDEAYDDGKGKTTVGIGFNMQQRDARKIWEEVFGKCVPFNDVLNGKRCLAEGEIQKLFQYTLKNKIKTAKDLFQQYDTYPDDVKTALVNGVFRGDFKKKHETVKLINKGEWAKVPKEYLDRDDYKTCERDGLSGIKKRLDWNAYIFRKYAEELKKKP